MIAWDSVRNNAAARITRQPSSLPRPLVIAMGLSCLAYTILCMHLPVALLADAGFDDGLFVQHGLSIVSGQWLGQYSQMTLAKGPGYPLFLALNAALGVPITLTQALFYCLACAVMARAILRMTGSAWLTLVCFLAMQWHPAVIPLRIVRDDLSPGQVLLILAAVCHFAFAPINRRMALPWAIVGGLMLGWLWLTREDAIWVLPGLLGIFLLQAVRLRRAKREALRLGVCILVFFLSMAATLATVAAINFHVYGIFATVDFKTSDFEKALNALESVRVGPPVAFVPVPAKVRQAVDQVSPAFASLEPYFKGPGQGWTQSGCAVYPSTCGDFAGGWFMWALRDAVAASGHYASPQAASAFYRQIWRQVTAACHAGRLQCRANPLPFMPAMTRSQWAQLPRDLLQLYRLATWRPAVAEWDFTQRLRDSSGDFTQLHTAERFLRNPRRTPARSEHGSVTLNGWFHSAVGQWVRLRCSDPDGELILPITRLPSPDIAAVYHHDAAMDRFSVTVPNPDQCRLETGDAGQAVQHDLGSLVPGIVDFGTGQLGVDRIQTSGVEGHSGLRVLHELDRLYAHLLSPAAILAILVFGATVLWQILRRRPWLTAPTILILGIWALLLTRAALLVLVDLSSFPAIIPLYWASGFPLLCLVILLSLALPFVMPSTARHDDKATGQDGPDFAS